MKILSKPKGNAEEYGRWACNPYVGCSHGCLYCYLKKGVWENNLGGNKPRLKKGIIDNNHALHVAMTEILANREQIIEDGGVFFSFTSDPLLDGESFFLTTDIAKERSEYGIPVTILTKTDKNRYLRDERKILLWFDDIDKFSMGWTLTGYDELEPYASSNDERIEAMRAFRHWLHSQRAKVWASIEPVISFDRSLEMIKKALAAGCQHFKIGLLTSNTHVVRKDFQFGEHHFDAYNRDKCIDFIHNVMRIVEDGDGKATVYWKQSFRDFLGEEDFARATVGYNNIVGKDWSMFKKED